jgi:hypothetical protein
MSRWFIICLLLVVGCSNGPVGAQEFVDQQWHSPDGVVRVKTALETEDAVERNGWRKYRLKLILSVEAKPTQVRPKRVLLTLHLPDHAVWWNRSRPSLSEADLDFRLGPDGALVWNIESRGEPYSELTLSLNFSAPGEPTIEVSPEAIYGAEEPIVYYLPSSKRPL